MTRPDSADGPEPDLWRPVPPSAAHAVPSPDTPPAPVEAQALAVPAPTPVPAPPAVPMPATPSPWATSMPEPTTVPTGPLPPPPVGRGRLDRPALGWTEIGIAALVYLLAQILLSGLALGLNDGELPSAPWLVALSGFSAFLAVGVAVVPRVRSGAALGLRRVRPRVVLGAVGLGVAVWVLSRIIIVAYILSTGDRSDPQADLTSFSGASSSVAVILLGGLLVPAGEELLFRGVLFGGLRRYGMWIAAGASALVFAVAHGFNVVLPAALLLGLVNAVLYDRTRSIWPPITVHAVFNLMSFGLLLLLR